MMKQTIKGLQAALFLALVVLGSGCVHRGDMASSLDSVSVRRAPVASLLKCQSDAFRIDLLGAVEAIPDDTLDAQREQLRDWIWMTTLGRIAPRTSVDDVFSGVMDQPLMRDDSLAHVLRLPVGPTRAVTTKKGEIIVLVEAASDAAMVSEVLEAIDDEALSLGHMPEQVQIYGYELRPTVAEANVCKIGGFDRGTLESGTQGYRSATITSAAALDQFLSGGVDLLSAQCTTVGLQVAGRQRPRNTRAKVTVEHVAALTQELGARYIPPARFGVTLDTLPREQRADLEERAHSFDQLLAASIAEQKEFQAYLTTLTEEDRRFLRGVFEWKEKNPAVPMTEILLSRLLQRQFDGKPGFSLDPVNTVASAMKSLDEIIDALQVPGKLTSLLRAWGDGFTVNHVLAAGLDRPTVQEIALNLTEARYRLQRARDEDVMAILLSRKQNPSRGAAIATNLLFSVWGRSGQQCARYDGPLAGTETGMTFFYTDLLAKITMFDWKATTLRADVEGFESVVHHVGSTAWCEEDSRPSTRLWFGVRDEAYARERAGDVRFAPIATRIFARGSLTGSGEEEEEEANAPSRRFIAWWDKHFARVAEWEPHYEVLNQLMKWSVVAQSARLAGDQSCLRFLQGAPVKHDQRFDRWVAETHDLKWRGPLNLVSEPQKATECLPLLTSETMQTCGVEHHITGGVGAASLTQVQAKAVRSAKTPVGFGRLSADSAPVTVGTNRFQFDELNGSGGKLRNVEIEGSGNQVTFKANIDTAASQRGNRCSSDPSTPVTTTAKSVESSGTEIALQQRSNDLRSTGLKASDLDRADVHLKVTPGVVEEAKTYSRRLADHVALDGGSLSDAAVALAGERDVRILKGGTVAVQLRGENGKPTWAIMTSGKGNRGPPGAVAGMVIGGSEGGPYRPGMGSASSQKPVHVSILSGEPAEVYLSSQGGERLPASNQTLLTVKEKLGSGDFADAMRALESRPTAPAADLLLMHAVDHGDMASARRVITVMGKKGSTADLAGLSKAIEIQSVLVTRKGGDPSTLARLSTQLSIDQRMRLVPGATENATIGILGQRLPVYRPAAYSSEGRLPAAVYPRGKSLSPSDQVVSRIIEIPSDLELPSTLKAADGSERNLHGAPGETLSDKRRAASAVGPATRLFSPMRRIVIVSHCSDTDESQPPCHEPPSGEERREFEEIKQKLCDQNGDGAWSTSAEHSCLADMGKCDHDGDGVWSTKLEVECLVALKGAP